MAVHLTPDLGNPNLYPMYNNLPLDQTPMIDYSSGYMSYPIYEPATPLSNPNQESGPFLYMPQPPSPDPTTPRASTFARNPSNIYNPGADEDRRVSNSSTSTSAQIPARYVSNSQFPETPLSVDPRGLGNRRTSYVNAAADEEELDDYDWAAQEESDQEEKEKEEVVAVKKLEVPNTLTSPTKPPLSPISPLDSNIQPVLDVPVSVSPQKGPPRGQRRARTVAGSYS